MHTGMLDGRLYASLFLSLSVTVPSPALTLVGFAWNLGEDIGGATCTQSDQR